MSELIPTVFAMAKKELLADLRLTQPGAPGVSTMPGTTTPSSSMVLPVKTKLSLSPFASSTVGTVGDYSTSCQDRLCCQVRCRHSAIAGINGKPVHGSPTLRKASIGHDHRWCSNKQSSSPQPGSPEAFMPQMIGWTRGVVYRQKSPSLAVHNTPLLDITSAFRTRTIKDSCADRGCLYDV